MIPTRISPPTRVIALALAALCTTMPAQAQSRQPDPATVRVLTAAAAPTRPEPIRAAARAEANRRSAELTQTTPAANGCANRVVLGGVIGAAAGAVAAVGLLYATGGSDSAGQVVKGYAVLGSAVGAVGGLVSCGP